MLCLCEAFQGSGWTFPEPLVDRHRNRLMIMFANGHAVRMWRPPANANALQSIIKPLMLQHRLPIAIALSVCLYV